MNKTAAALVTIAATFALAGPSIADEPPPPEPTQCAVPGQPVPSYCQPWDPRAVIDENMALHKQVDELEQRVIYLEFRVKMKTARLHAKTLRIRLLRERLQDARN